MTKHVAVLFCVLMGFTFTLPAGAQARTQPDDEAPPVVTVTSGLPSVLSVERVPEEVMRPLRIQRIDPVYPVAALRDRIQGTVVLDAKITAEGVVEDVVRVSGDPELVPTAIEAVKKWKYIPYDKHGRLIPVVSTVRLTFSLAEHDRLGAVSEPDLMEEEIVPARGAVPLHVRVSAGVSKELLVQRVNPEYPQEAREQHIQGTVLLQATIDKEGNVSKLETISGDSALAPAAIEAVRQWKYRPYRLNGQVVEMETQVSVNFSLAK